MHEDDPKAAEPRRRMTDSQKAARRVLSVLAEINQRPSSRDSRTIAAERDARSLVDEQQNLMPLVKTARHALLEEAVREFIRMQDAYAAPGENELADGEKLDALLAKMRDLVGLPPIDGAHAVTS